MSDRRPLSNGCFNDLTRRLIVFNDRAPLRQFIEHDVVNLLLSTLENMKPFRLQLHTKLSGLCTLMLADIEAGNAA
ncbi:hypothetical protein EON83_30060 [bacterium]|nr:MAG: hypothetical protein EON83_30060 [bacterium]